MSGTMAAAGIMLVHILGLGLPASAAVYDGRVGDIVAHRVGRVAYHACGHLEVAQRGDSLGSPCLLMRPSLMVADCAGVKYTGLDLDRHGGYGVRRLDADGAAVADIPADKGAVGKDVVSRAAESIDAKGHTKLTGLHAEAAEKRHAHPSVEKLHRPAVAEVGLHEIVNRRGNLAGESHAGIEQLKAVETAVGLHLPAGTYRAADFGHVVDLGSGYAVGARCERRQGEYCSCDESHGRYGHLAREL